LSGSSFAQVVNAAFNLGPVDPWLFPFTMQKGEHYSIEKAAAALSRHVPRSEVRKIIALFNRTNAAAGNSDDLAYIFHRAGNLVEAVHIAEKIGSVEALCRIASDAPLKMKAELLHKARHHLAKIRGERERLNSELLILSLESREMRTKGLAAL